MNYAKKRQPYSMWLFSSPYSYERFRTFDGSGPGYSRWSAREQAVYSHTWQRITFSTAFYTDWNKNVHYETSGDTLQDYPIFLTMIINLLFIRLAEHFNTSAGWILT